MPEKHVLIVDDHAVMRQGLKLILADLDYGLAIHESGDGDSMLEQFRQKKIDLLVMDIHLPNTDSIRMVELVSIRYPGTYILIFSMLPEHIYGRRLLRAGARGFLPKLSTIDEIRGAFEQAFNHKMYLSNGLSELLHKEGRDDGESDPFALLSDREFEIVNLLLSGSHINSIAQRLNLKHSTVGTYKARIFDKLRVRTIFELKDLAILHNFNHYYLDC
jgi:DNA-binding NarL/FixJ family response regulator